MKMRSGWVKPLISSGAWGASLGLHKFQTFPLQVTQSRTCLSTSYIKDTGDVRFCIFCRGNVCKTTKIELITLYLYIIIQMKGGQFVLPD